MSRILVVEDEIFVAAEIESIIADMGHEPVGIAADRRTALALADDADIALVDLNLVDGPTGIDVGRTLADRGVTVLFITANPSQLGDGVPGTIGVLPKPADGTELEQAVAFAISLREKAEAARPPRRLRLFDRWQGSAGFAAAPIG
ncbi:Response regulator receiver domain-containing protein [Devosia enhydra]|uniref:Response regulator receiver domain-containing protein n=1 Tax=Devosia enhydra TaxID=665118 RepID=A0A1K2HU20_9HYPH|nr:response regulator [Devosia enhydra]SFZ81827.1 Response regulator receiver domain-containing protein [Devosia enhydra]